MLPAVPQKTFPIAARVPNMMAPLSVIAESQAGSSSACRRVLHRAAAKMKKKMMETLKRTCATMMLVA
jgi:hypothetical protein